MKRTLLALSLFALAAVARAGAVYNCPRHGPRDSWQVERRGLSFVCKACEQEKAQKGLADEAKAREERVARGEIFESDLRHLPRVTVNTRSFGSTNNFERMCLAAIRGQYVAIGGRVRRRADGVTRFKIIQSLGNGAYLARHGETYYKLENVDAVLVDDAAYDLAGELTGGVFDYTTVLGAAKRVRVFRVLPFAEVSFADVLAHLQAGGTLTFPLEYGAVEQPQPMATSYRDLRIIAQGNNLATPQRRRIEATVTMTGGLVVHFGK